MVAITEPQLVDTSYLEVLSDAELTRMVKSGSDGALSVLLRRHRDPLYRFCLHLMRDPHDAEDICQESLARAIMRVDSLQAGAAFRGWLFSIARNLSIDSFRARKRTCPIPDEEITVLPAPLRQDGPYQKVESSEEYQTVAQAMSRLKKNHQTVLMLREVEGLSYAEIALQLDVSESAVETLLFRARKRLREEYTRADAPMPLFGLVGSLRGLFHRLASPVQRYASPLIKGAPITAKVTVTAVMIGGAIVATPHVVPVLHAFSGSPAKSAPAMASARNAPPVAGTASLTTAPSASTSRVPTGSSQGLQPGKPVAGAHRNRSVSTHRGSGSSGSAITHSGGTAGFTSIPSRRTGSRPSSGATGDAGSFRTAGHGATGSPATANGQLGYSTPGTRPATQPGSGRSGRSSSSTAGGAAPASTSASRQGGASHGSAGSSHSSITPGNPASTSAGSSTGTPAAPQPVVGPATAVATQVSDQTQAAAATAQTQVTSAPVQVQTSVAGVASQAAAQVSATAGVAQSQAGGTASQQAGQVKASAAGASTAVAETAGQVKGSVPPVKEPALTVTPVPRTGAPPVTVPPVKKTVPPVPTPAPLPLKP